MLLLAWMILLKRLKRELVVDTSCWIELLLLEIQSSIESTQFETHSRITKVLKQIGECSFYQQIQFDSKLHTMCWIKLDQESTRGSTTYLLQIWKLYLEYFWFSNCRVLTRSNTYSWNRSDAAAAKVHKSSSKVGHNKLNLKVGTILGLS